VALGVVGPAGRSGVAGLGLAASLEAQRPRSGGAATGTWRCGGAGLRPGQEERRRLVILELAAA
jgi:hypothetical protein